MGFAALENLVVAAIQRHGFARRSRTEIFNPAGVFGDVLHQALILLGHLLVGLGQVSQINGFRGLCIAQERNEQGAAKDKAAQRMGNTHGISNNEASLQFSSALSAGLLTKSRKTCINGYPYSRYSAYPSMGLARGFVSCRITRAFEGCR